jgi:hypothetical protein
MHVYLQTDNPVSQRRSGSNEEQTKALILLELYRGATLVSPTLWKLLVANQEKNVSGPYLVFFCVTVVRSRINHSYEFEMKFDERNTPCFPNPIAEDSKGAMI